MTYMQNLWRLWPILCFSFSLNQLHYAAQESWTILTKIRSVWTIKRNQYRKISVNEAKVNVLSPGVSSPLRCKTQPLASASHPGIICLHPDIMSSLLLPPSSPFCHHHPVLRTLEIEFSSCDNNLVIIISHSGWLRCKYKCERQWQPYSFALCCQVNIDTSIHIVIITIILSIFTIIIIKLSIILIIILSILIMQCFQIHDIRCQQRQQECQNWPCLNLHIGFKHQEGPWYQWDIIAIIFKTHQIDNFKIRWRGGERASSKEKWGSWPCHKVNFTT